jgi:hypothetical protein
MRFIYVPYDPLHPRDDYDPWNLNHVAARYELHRRVIHNGDMNGFYDCATCGALESRLERLMTATAESKQATKQ